jgi:purine-nucleoside phosphorylase
MSQSLGLDTAVVLGSGWGNAVTLEKGIINLPDVHPIFSQLARLDAHARKLGVAKIGGKTVLVVSGRIHMFEGDRDAVYLLMRIVWELGIRKLILTSATGGLRDYIHTGDFVVITDLVKNLSSPVDGPPFPNPHAMICNQLMHSIFAGAPVNRVHIGHCISNAGPDFESPGDRLQIDRPGLQSVGMSGRTEAACFASFVEQAGLKAGKHAIVVPITAISNDVAAEHGHASNTAAMIANSDRLSKMLKHTVRETAARLLEP